MARLLLADKEQLKCNLCTQWYSVNKHFANCQRYSFNACPQCFVSPPYLVAQDFRQYDLLWSPRGHSLSLSLESLDKALISLPQLSSSYIRLADLYSDLQKSICSTSQFISSHYRREMEELMQQRRGLDKQLEDCFMPMKQLFEDAVYQLSHQAIPMGQSETHALFIKCLEHQREVEGAHEKATDLDRYVRQTLKQISQPLRQSRCFKNTLAVPQFQGAVRRQKGAMSQSFLIQNISSPMKSSIKSRDTPQKSFKKLDRPKVQGKSWGSNKENQGIKSQRTMKILRQKVMHNKNIQQSKATISGLLSTKKATETYLSTVCVKEQSVIKKSYSKHNMVEAIIQAKGQTKVNEDSLQLVCSSVQLLDFDCYLKSLKLPGSLKMIRVIKAGLVDADFDSLLRLLARIPTVQTLVATNNHLTSLSVHALLTFKQREPHSRLAYVYLANNQIKPSLVRPVMSDLLKQGVNLLL